VSALAARVAAVVPCKDEADRIAATVAAVASLPQVGRVVVVDDGSTDGTARVAEAAGADVVRHARNRGKAAALESGVRRVRELEVADAVAQADDADHADDPGGAGDPGGARSAALLFVDGDLQESATNLGVLTAPVLDGRAAMTIATLPAQITAGGGRGLVVGLARRGIEHLTGFRALQPLSGMRCLSPEAYDAGSPLARGWGVETALTVDVLRAGLPVLEVPCELQHRVSGSDWRGHLHRAGQYRDVWLALVRRGWRPWQRA
jgi:hypothetical protein